MTKRMMAMMVLGAAWAAGCAGQHQHNYAAKQACPECGKEWLDGMSNRQDNGYGSVHYFDTWETLRDTWAKNGVMAEDAAARADALIGARSSFWQTHPQVLRDVPPTRP